MDFLRGFLPGILYLAGIAAFCIIVFWSATNDAAGNEGGFKGLLGMKGAPDEDEAQKSRAKPKAGRSRWGRKAR